jgi:hypothetical protein
MNASIVGNDSETSPKLQSKSAYGKTSRGLCLMVQAPDAVLSVGGNRPGNKIEEKGNFVAQSENRGMCLSNNKQCRIKNRALSISFFVSLGCVRLSW